MKRLLLLAVLGVAACTPETYINNTPVDNLQKSVTAETGQLIVGFTKKDSIPISIDYEVTYAPAGMHGLDFDHVHFYGESRRGYMIAFDAVVVDEEVVWFGGLEAVGFSDLDTECGWCDCMETLFEENLNNWVGYTYAALCPECAIATMAGFAIVCGFGEIVNGGPDTIEG